MPSQAVPFRKPRMVKIIGKASGHVQSFHHRDRPLVQGRCEGHDFPEPPSVKTHGQEGRSGFGRVALPPIGPIQPPANFHTWGEVGFEGRDGKPGEARQKARSLFLQRVKPEMVLLKMFLDSVHEPAALLPGKNTWHKFHDPGVRVHPVESLPVGIFPTAKVQAGGFDPIHVLALNIRIPLPANRHLPFILCRLPPYGRITRGGRGVVFPSGRAEQKESEAASSYPPKSGNPSGLDGYGLSSSPRTEFHF